MAENDNVEVEEEDAAAMCCAACGKADIDDFKLNKCDKCDLARYCSDDYQQDHLEIHAPTCKERVAELRDEILFRQPESSYRGECPICFLPLPPDILKSRLYFCCCKIVCNGCIYGNRIREIEQQRCPFCRKLVPDTKTEGDKMLMKRAEANDPIALGKLGQDYCLEMNFDIGLQYLRMSAELGDGGAHGLLAQMYQKGQGVEKDEERAIYYLEEAAIAGDPEARHNIGCIEWNCKRRFDRAVKHWIIAANLGCDKSLKMLKTAYIDGHVSKDDFTLALRTYQVAVEATKSPQREEADMKLSDGFTRSLRQSEWRNGI